VQKKIFAFFYALFFIAPQIVFADQFDTFTSWNGDDAINAWGVPNNQTFGEVLTTDLSILLTDFSFYLKKFPGHDQVNFKAYVYSWDDVSNKINGTALFSSDLLTSPASSSSFTKVTISTNNIHLAANSKYVLFFSTSGLSQSVSLGQYTMGFDYKTGGVPFNSKFVYKNDSGANNFSELATSTWDTFSFADLAYIINYNYFSGPAAADTQSSMQYQSRQLRSAFNTQIVAANFALNYDCTLFDVKGMCISAGGRYTTIDNPNINNSAAVVTLGYKVNPNIRVGAYLDQNINISNATGINISNNTPLMGLYAVWNKEQSGLGYQVRLANTYQDKDVTQTRTVFDTSEAGSGKSSLQSQSYLTELSYAFQYQDKTLVRPYAGLRYTHLKQKGYTEDTADTVTDPLTLAAIRDKGMTALLGVKVNRSLTDKATLTAQLGLEQDLHHKVDQYSGTDLNGSELTAIAFNSNIKRTRPVASAGAYYAVAKNQRLSGEVYYQQLPFQSTGSATAYFNYMIGF
jgi:hypothetical protein